MTKQFTHWFYHLLRRWRSHLQKRILKIIKSLRNKQAQRRFSRRRTARTQPSVASSRPSSQTISTDSITYTFSRAEIVESLNRTLYGDTILQREHAQIPADSALTNSAQHTAQYSPSKHADAQLHTQRSHYQETLDTLADSAFLCERQGRLVEAERLYKQVISLRIRQLGHIHLSVAEAYVDLAALYLSQNRYAEAEPLLHHSLQVRIQLLSAYHLDIAENCHQLATIYRHQNQYSKAEPLFQCALSVLRHQLGKEHPRTQAVYDDLMQMLITVINTDQYHKITKELPPLDLDNLSDRYPWAKPNWHNP